MSTLISIAAAAADLPRLLSRMAIMSANDSVLRKTFLRFFRFLVDSTEL